MAAIILHDTALAALADGEYIFLYFQLANGCLCETMIIQGQPQVAYVMSNLRAADIKLYTALAASFGNNKTERYLFYIDNNNILNNAVFRDNQWTRGSLRNQSITPAHYSKLAAAPSSTNANEIHVFYQTTNLNGAVRQVTGCDPSWTTDRRDFGDKILTGTGLAAVRANSASSLSSNAQVPIVFYQKSNLGLAWLQETVTRDLNDVETKDSPHTPLAATDADAINNIFLFYTSNINEIKRLVINANGQQVGPTDMTATTPKGNLAVTIRKSSVGTTSVFEVIIFYQLANPTSIQEYSAGRYSTDTCICQAKYTVTGAGDAAKLSVPEIGHVEMKFE